MPKVLNKHKDGMPTGAVYIGRPSKWGNPFVIGKDGTRSAVIMKYKRWLKRQPELMEAAKKELAGKDLVCFCAPYACHGDVLIEVANAANEPKSRLIALLSEVEALSEKQAAGLSRAIAMLERWQHSKN